MPRRPLTPRQARFVEEYVKSGNATKAVTKAGYTQKPESAKTTGSRLLSNVNVRVEVAEALRAQNLGMHRIAKVLDRALEAESKMIIGPGMTETQPDHGTQLKAADMLAKLADAYPVQAASTHEHRHLHVEATEPIEVMRFRVMHGRAPTERELIELGCVNSVENPVIEAECEQVPGVESDDGDAK